AARGQGRGRERGWRAGPGGCDASAMRGRSSRWRRVPGSLAFGLVLLAGCSYRPVSSPSGVETIPEPRPEEVESVLFLLGDAGEAREGTSPLLERLAEDIERWSAELERDSAVALLVLGD